MARPSRKKTRERQPRSKTIKINLKYRNVKCSGCKKEFRAGFACQGYFELVAIGYHAMGLPRESLLCPGCKEIVYHLLGHTNEFDHWKAPTALYSFPKKGKISNRPTSMEINGKHMKYNKNKLQAAVDRFSRKMKRREPWSNVDYYEFAGLKKPRSVS